MADETNYTGSPRRIMAHGGSIAVVIPADPYQIQANAGVSLPCAGCLVVARTANASPVHMNIEANASAALGIEVPEGSGAGSAIWVPIDDVSKLYFYSGTAGDDIDILYFT